MDPRRWDWWVKDKCICNFGHYCHITLPRCYKYCASVNEAVSLHLCLCRCQTLDFCKSDLQEIVSLFCIWPSFHICKGHLTSFFIDFLSCALFFFFCWTFGLCIYWENFLKEVSPLLYELQIISLGCYMSSDFGYDLIFVLSFCHVEIYLFFGMFVYVCVCVYIYTHKHLHVLVNHLFHDF